MSWRRNKSPMTIMSSQNQRTNINTAKTSATKLRNVKPSARKSIAILLVHWTALLRASRAACAFFVACDTLRSSPEELVSAAVDLAAHACLRLLCRRLGDAEETEQRDAWLARGVPLLHVLLAPLACACG